MRKIYLKNLPAYQFQLLQKFSDHIQHAVFTREGGVSMPPFASLNLSFTVQDSRACVNKNRKLVSEALNIQLQDIFYTHQTHSKNISIVDEEHVAYAESREVQNTDAFITQLKKTALLITIADCQAILMYDPVKQVIANIHAGWKGLEKDISGATIQLLKKKFKVDPATLLAAISPSLGPCCAFFSNPKTELPQQFHEYIDAQKRVDLWNFSINQLQQHGLKRENIELAKICTQCGGHGEKQSMYLSRKKQPKKFFSFRREGGFTGRFGVMIFLNPE